MSITSVFEIGAILEIASLEAGNSFGVVHTATQLPLASTLEDTILIKKIP